MREREDAAREVNLFLSPTQKMATAAQSRMQRIEFAPFVNIRYNNYCNTGNTRYRHPLGKPKRCARNALQTHLLGGCADVLVTGETQNFALEVRELRLQCR